MSLYSVYVPTNHIYVGDVFLMGEVDIIKPNLSVREGLGELLYFAHACLSHALSVVCNHPYPAFISSGTEQVNFSH